MSRSIKLSSNCWNKIHSQLLEDYPKSVVLIRDVMKRKLGFTTRTHREWQPGMVSYEEHVMLDFFNEPKRTMFLLKYSDFLDDNN